MSNHHEDRVLCTSVGHSSAMNSNATVRRSTPTMRILDKLSSRRDSLSRRRFRYSADGSITVSSPLPATSATVPLQGFLGIEPDPLTEFLKEAATLGGIVGIELEKERPLFPIEGTGRLAVKE